MLSTTITKVTYPAGEGDLINIEYDGSTTEETSVGSINSAIADIDQTVLVKLFKIWWKERSNDFSDDSIVEGKTIVLNLASNGLLLTVG